MAASGHSYGPSCLLQPESNTFTRRASEVSPAAPPIKAHYFYCSALPIDDPLSPVPPPPTGTTVKQKLPPRPFSVPDNVSLEEVWLSIHDTGKEKKPSSRQHNETSQKEKSRPPAPVATSSVNNLAKILKEAKAGSTKEGKTGRKKGSEEPPTGAEDSTAPKSAEMPGNEVSSRSPHALQDSKASKVDQHTAGDQNSPALDSFSHSRTSVDNKKVEGDKKAKKSAKDTHATEEDAVTAGSSTGKPKETAQEDRSSHLGRKTAQAIGKAKVFSHGDFEPAALQSQSDLDLCDDPDHIQSFSAAQRVQQPDLTLFDDPDHIPFDETMPVGIEEIGNDEFEGNVQKRRGRHSFRQYLKKNKDRSKSPGNAETPEEVETEADLSSYRRLSVSTQKAHDSKQKSHNSRQKSRDSKKKDKDSKVGSSPAVHDTTGTPFLRIPSDSKRSRSRSRSRSPEAELEPAQGAEEREALAEKQKSVFSKPGFQRLSSAPQSGDGQSEQMQTSSADQASEGRWGFFKKDDGRPSSRKEQKKLQEVYITVGVSRLHVVEMRSLKMGPIYWDPVHDISSVVRGTWFYKETMWPVESDVANQSKKATNISSHGQQPMLTNSTAVRKLDLKLN